MERKSCEACRGQALIELTLVAVVAAVLISGVTLVALTMRHEMKHHFEGRPALENSETGALLRAESQHFLKVYKNGR